jgi:hypothetical protein
VHSRRIVPGELMCRIDDKSDMVLVVLDYGYQSLAAVVEEMDMEVFFRDKKIGHKDGLQYYFVSTYNHPDKLSGLTFRKVIWK